MNKNHFYKEKKLEKYKEFIESIDTSFKNKEKEKEKEIIPFPIKKRKYIRLLTNKTSDEFDTKYNNYNTSLKEYNDPNIFEEPIIIVIEKKKMEEPKKRERKCVNIDVEIHHLADLIQLMDTYPDDPEVDYNINMSALHKIKPALEELNHMIGLHSIKENVVDQILYFIQDFHKSSVQDFHKSNDPKTDNDFMHTVIYGPPGTGKTEVAKIMGKIFSQMGILKKGVFKKVTRSDLIAGYLGQTAIKTKDVIKECIGGCLFIDEAYSLGNNDKKDSFSKECIDTLCEALSDYKDELMVIIAGYEKELNECFFSYNQGLDSRFIWRFKTEEYKGKELYQIFLKKVGDCGWTFQQQQQQGKEEEWFEKNHEYFKFYGRDIEALLSKTKIMHSRRVFCKGTEEKKKILMKDLEKGFECFLKNEEVKKRKEQATDKNTLYSMYV